MEGMGQERKNYMYEYVTEKQAAPYKSFCQSVLDKLQAELKREYGIATRVTLVGSGAINMITRNGKSPFDLDFNLILTAIPRESVKSAEELKTLVRRVLDRLVSGKVSAEKSFFWKKDFSCGQDSTSSITYLLHSPDGKSVEFKFDLALILEKNGSYSRLVHDKKQEKFFWNLIPKSKDLETKLAAVQAANRQADVRNIYLRKKNEYLRRQDRNHPSYIVYIEAVHQAYQKLQSE